MEKYTNPKCGKNKLKQNVEKYTYTKYGKIHKYKMWKNILIQNVERFNNKKCGKIH